MLEVYSLLASTYHLPQIERSTPLPRTPRKKSRTGIYHVIIRGVNRQTIFENREDRAMYVRTLARYKKKSKFELYSYCLMNNHVHLLVKEVDEPISVVMKRLNSSYVHNYNVKYDRVGHLFQERFKSECVEDRDYFMTLLRYIHQNPLKAGVVKSVWDSPWTSVHEYISIPKYVDVDRALKVIGKDRKDAIARFISLMEEVVDDSCMEYMDTVRLSDEEIREYLVQLGVANSSILQRMNVTERNHILVELSSLKGASYRQLERVTGISKSVIQRLKRRDSLPVPLSLHHQSNHTE
nr:transposase [Pontibacillus halophilus]